MASVVEWILAMWAIQSWGIQRREREWQWLALAMLPPILPIAALALMVMLGVALYGGALQLIAPERIAEALRFARTRGGSEDNEGEGDSDAAPAPAE